MGNAIPGRAVPGAATPGSPGPVTVLTPFAAPPALPAPSVPFFPAGYQPTEADFFEWWYLNARFEQCRVVFRARQTATENMVPVTGTPAQIEYDTVDEDSWGGWSPSTFSYLPPVSGMYQVTVTSWTTALPANAMLVPYLLGTYSLRGAVIPGSPAHNAGAAAQFTVYLVAGQSAVAGGVAILNAVTAVTTSVVSGQRSSIEIEWLSL
ncbi:MAG TPA: hypothetical protein VFQ44_02005 [Streptosporangiaceae bacterium]|nr:hypothetical protein [Streptosporangiaceae bacterium]